MYQCLKGAHEFTTFYHYSAAYGFLYCTFTTKLHFRSSLILDAIVKDRDEKRGERNEAEAFKLKTREANQSDEERGKKRDAKDREMEVR